MPLPANAAAWAVLAGLVALGGWIVLRPPCLGVSDNLDYWRVMRPAGIAHLAPVKRPGAFVQCHYSASDADLASGASSPALIAWAARGLGGLFSQPPHRMDLRQAGTLYLLAVAGLVVAGRVWRVPLPLAAGWLFVLVDPGYLLFANSFYADPALLVALLGLAYWFAQDAALDPRARRPGRWAPGRVVALVLLVLLGGASKMQYVLLPAVAATAAVPFVVGRAPAGDVPRRIGRGPLAALGVLLALAVLVPLHFSVGSGPRFLRANNYHAVYAGLLRVTREPERALRALEIPREDWDLPRRDVWSARIPPEHPVHEALRSLSRWRLLALYVSDPVAMRATARRIATTLAREQTHRRGTYPRSAGRRPGAQYRPAWAFARLHAGLFGRYPAALWWLLGGALAGVSAQAARGRWTGLSACAALLVLFASSQLVVVVLGDGFVALEQHLLGARLAVDYLLVLTAYAAATGLYRWGRRRAGPRAAPAPGPGPQRPRSAA